MKSTAPNTANAICITILAISEPYIKITKCIITTTYPRVISRVKTSLKR